MTARSRTSDHSETCKRELALDEALSETFPASDPIAVGAATGTEPPAAPVDRRSALIDPEDVERVRRDYARSGA